MNVMNYARIGGQALAVGALVREIRRASAEGDKLRLLDAVVNFLAVATTIAIVIRELRNRRSGNNDHDGDQW
jgi:large-conductance mechanosensitive channel